MVSNWFSKDVDLAVAAQLRTHFSQQPMMNRPFVTISRMYGCDGKELSGLIVEKMNAQEKGKNWFVVSREMLLAAAQEGKLTKETLAELERFGHSEVKSYIRDAIFGMGNLVEAVQQISHIFHLFAKRGRVIFLGGGASIVTQDLTGGTHLQLYAPEDWRIKNHARRWSLDESVARKKVIDRTVDREAFVKTFLGEDLYDNRFYHLTINNAEVSPEVAAEAVCAMIMARQEQLASRES